jgi:fructoselysine-6-P-deglycase FrlB-like protein
MQNRETFSWTVWNQPSALETATRHISTSITKASIAPWKPGETVAVISMGASSHSANALIWALTEQGVRGVNITASDLFDAPDGFEPGDHNLIVSESGRSPEPIDVARRLRTGSRIAITNYPEAEIAGVSDAVVSLGGIPDSPVYTAGYIATLTAYSALLRAAGLPDRSFDESTVPAIVQESLDRYGPQADDIAEFFDDVSFVDFAGLGVSFTSAAQGALVFREALRLPTAGYELYQYLHGPMESAREGTGLVLFGDGRGLGIVASQAEAGVKVLVVSAGKDDELNAIAHKNVRVIQLPEASSGFTRVIAETVALHVMTEAIAKRRGITIEEFLYSQPDTKIGKDDE